MTTCAAILAAGSGSRFASPEHKLLAHLGDGEPISVTAVRTAADAGIGLVIVVVGAEPGVAAAVSAAVPAARLVTNSQWESGQATSVQAAVAAARELGADRVVVGLGDQPFVTADAWRHVARTDAPIAVATYDGRRGNPVLLRHDVWPLLPREGDRGARVVSTMRPDLVVEVPCAGSSVDIDTVEDLQQWQSNSSTNSPSTGPSKRPGR